MFYFILICAVCWLKYGMWNAVLWCDTIWYGISLLTFRMNVLLHIEQHRIPHVLKLFLQDKGMESD